MNLRTRLQRVERKAKVQSDADVPDDGQGPPCPQGIDPASWASRMRICRFQEARLTGALGPGEYLPDMDEAERHYVDDLAVVFAEVARWGMQESAGAVGGPTS